MVTREMGHVFFIRHGQTEWNVEHRIAGITDVALTETGRRQAEETGKAILAQGIEADAILHSPLQRAADTAAILSSVTGIPCRPEPRMREQDFGRWEGRRTDSEDFLADKQRFACRCGGGESMLQVAQRIYNLMDELKKQPEKVFILVAHNGVARIVKTYFQDMSNEEFATFTVKNGEILRFDF